jgi:hypothetical protein
MAVTELDETGYHNLLVGRNVPAIKAGTWWTSHRSLVEVLPTMRPFQCHLKIDSNCHESDLREIAAFLIKLADTGQPVL